MCIRDSTWTWTEAQAAAEKIRALGDDIWGYYQPISYNEFYKSVKGNGGSLLNEDYTDVYKRQILWCCRA